MNKIMILLATMVAANAGDFQCSTNSLGEVTLEQYTPSEGETVLVIPQHVSAVAPWALLNRLWVQTVYLPNKTLHIGTGAFYGCSNLRHVRLSPGTRSIGPLAFSRCVALESVIVPQTCETGALAFEGCYSLTDWAPWLAFQRTGDTLTLVYEGILQGSTNLTDWVDLPDSEGLRLMETNETVNYYRTRR